jgi:leader peptidase (prepilin peptidase)/N-methyltransferase
LSIEYYLLLRHCPACERLRSSRTWIVLLLSIAVTLVIALYPSPRLGFWPGWLLLTYFGVVAVIDIEHRLILHPVSLFGAVLGLVYGVWLHGWLVTLLGGASGFLIMLVLYWLGGLFAKGLAKMRGQEIDEVALGFGDVNLSGVLGLILGWPGITAGLIGAILLGGLGSLLVLLSMLVTRRYQAFIAIPYAPFLILSAIFLLFRH